MNYTDIITKIQDSLTNDELDKLTTLNDSIKFNTIALSQFTQLELYYEKNPLEGNQILDDYEDMPEFMREVLYSDQSNLIWTRLTKFRLFLEINEYRKQINEIIKKYI